MSFYDDDFENNNPFAEPVVNDGVDEVTRAIERKRREEEEALVNQNRQQETEEKEEEGDEGVHPDYSNDTSGIESESYATPGISNALLRKIVPERFAKYLLRFKLTAIEKNRPGNPILRFNVVVNGLPKFSQKTYSDVRRTFIEVQKFNKYLIGSNLECFVPVIPEAVSAYTGDEAQHYLSRAWQEWFDRISANPIIIRDEEFVYFVEHDFGYSVINNNQKLSVASGLLRKTLKQLAPPEDPIVPLAEFRPQIKGAYLDLQKVHKQLDQRSKTEKQVLVHTFDLANKFQLMASCETHASMKNLWEKLAKLTTRELDLMCVDATNEMGALADGLWSMLEDFYEIKEALTNRYLIMRELKTAQELVDSKEAYAAKMKLKTTLDPLRVDDALHLVETARQTRDSMEVQVKRILGEMLCERKEVIEHTEKKLKQLLEDYTLKKVQYHRKLLRNLETIRLDVRMVDAKGGLSRLNRENLSTIKHNLPLSQAEDGDAWTSRTFRLQKESGDKAVKVTKLNAKNAAALLGVGSF